MLTERRQNGGQGKVESEAELLAALRAGDLRAFETAYRCYQPRLSRFVATIVRARSSIEEVVNDTLMVLWEKADSFSGGSKLSTWLFAIAYRKAIRAHLRFDEPVDSDPVADIPDDDAMPDRDFARARTSKLLQRAIDDLSADHRAVVHLTYFQELSYRDIADIMGCPTDTVKTRMFHARRYLKDKLDGELADWI
ncbi:MAG: sigma-70 family RNA polymerase sigma factor [Sphingobium sp.]|nr:sigma-70 family RNA polymerase sigma factor [Sphingobium sp.]